LAHFGSIDFFYGMALFMVGKNFLVTKIFSGLDQVFHKIWLFVIFCLFFGSFRADPWSISSEIELGLGSFQIRVTF
jgi:hypothetical protein